MEHGLNHAGRGRHLPAGRFLVSGDGGAILSGWAVVPQWFGAIEKSAKYLIYKNWNRQSSRRIEKMKLEIDQQGQLAEMETLAAFSDASLRVTRIGFHSHGSESTGLDDRALEEARLAVRAGCDWKYFRAMERRRSEAPAERPVL